MVQNPQRASKDLDLGKHEGRIFGDYENLLVAATSYCVTTSGDGSGGTYYSYDMSSTQRAVEKLCQIETPVSTNLLHHISRLKDINVRSRDAEVEYSAEHPTGMAYQTNILSFESQRRAAKKELARRGNLDYDLSAYKAEGCWRIPT